MSTALDAADGAREIARFHDLVLDPHIAALQAQLSRACAALGFERFMLCQMKPATPVDQTLFITDYSPDWLRRYLRNGYRSHDLVAAKSASLRRPFLWSEIQERRHLTDAQCRVIDEARTFGLRYGGTRLLASDGAGPTAFCVSTVASERDFAKLFQARQAELEELHVMANKAIQELLNAPPGASNPPGDAAPVQLTPHENEALMLAARGLTRKQTAEAMKISEHTVKDHWEQAQLKLRARNKTHAVAKALAAGYIWP